MPVLSADVDVELDVVDRNNKPPVWDANVYGPIHIKENVTVGTVVTSVKARRSGDPQTFLACSYSLSKDVAREPAVPLRYSRAENTGCGSSIVHHAARHPELVLFEKTTLAHASQSRLRALSL
ncbi:CADN protein, partial [Acromyrmex insinuator]